MSDPSKIYSEDTVQWRASEGLTPYPDAVTYMETRAKAIAADEAQEQVWLLEHPPL